MFTQFETSGPCFESRVLSSALTSPCTALITGLGTENLNNLQSCTSRFGDSQQCSVNKSQQGALQANSFFVSRRAFPPGCSDGWTVQEKGCVILLGQQKHHEEQSEATNLQSKHPILCSPARAGFVPGRQEASCVAEAAVP